MRPYWPDYVRTMVSLAVILVGGAATAYATGGFYNKDTAGVLFIFTTSAYTFYRNVWKPTVAKWLEEHTTPGESVPAAPSVQTPSAADTVPLSAAIVEDLFRVLLPGAEAQLKAAAKVSASPAPAPVAPAPVPSVTTENPYSAQNAPPPSQRSPFA